MTRMRFLTLLVPLALLAGATALTGGAAVPPAAKEPCTCIWAADPAWVRAVAGPRRARRIARPDRGP